MFDLPSQALLQQAHARTVSGEELEVMGKKAAAGYASGDYNNLTEAVVGTVKKAGLSPEQVQRVIEFTNQAAYLHEFQKVGSANKYVEFVGGPASPSEVLKDLNDGGGGTVFDRGSADYSSPPPTEKIAYLHLQNLQALGLEKTAAPLEDMHDRALAEAFAVEPEHLRYADPYQDTWEVREKLASEKDRLSSDLNFLETSYHELGQGLYWQVKQAAMEGTPLGHILQAWAAVTPGPGFVKAAFALVGPKLVEEQIFDSHDAVAGSLTKTAEAGWVPNPDHPLLQTYGAFCTQLEKLADTRAELEVVDGYLGRVDWFLKQAMLKEAASAAPLAQRGVSAAKSLWGGAKQVANAASKPVGEIATAIGGEGAGNAATWATQHVPHAVAALAAKEFYDRGIKYGPGQLPLRYAKSQIPGTREYYVRQYNLQQGAMPM